MSLSLSQLNALVKLISSNPNEAKAVIKLASIEVLNSMGDGKYTILIDGKTTAANSDKTLKEGEKYWSLVSESKDGISLLKTQIKPQILTKFYTSSAEYSIRELHNILNSKNPTHVIKQHLLEKLANSSTKDEFTVLSNLLLSIEHQTMTIPLFFNNTFSILQFKKRYNYKKNIAYMDFYAALEFLGPVSGLISVENGEVTIELSVAFENTKNFLELDMKNFSQKIRIMLAQNIEPLYYEKSNSLLDVSI